MKFVEIPGKGNVDIAFYNVIDYKAENVGDFIQEAIDIIGGKCGTFKIKDNPPMMGLKIQQFKPQEEIEMLINTNYDFYIDTGLIIPLFLARMPIKKVTASGGWGKTEFEIYV